MKILIVKFGALGDVVRTSYFAEALKRGWAYDAQLVWITANSATPILLGNPYIDRVVTDFADIVEDHFDLVFSLDDEEKILRQVAQVKTDKITGAYLDQSGRHYTDDVAVWFDMGLLSRFGKSQADYLKRVNELTHGEIFAEIFGVSAPIYSNHVGPALPRCGDWGLNLTAGERWPAKTLPLQTAHDLIDTLLKRGGFRDLLLLGGESEMTYMLALKERFADEPRMKVCNTGTDLSAFSALVGSLDILITADTLAMHLAISQLVPVLAFFTVTSAAEIGAGSWLHKVCMNGADYCSYKPRIENSGVDLEDFLDGMAAFEKWRRARGA